MAESGFDVVANLPLEVSVFIFSLLPTADIGQGIRFLLTHTSFWRLLKARCLGGGALVAARVSRVWHEVATNDALWHVLYEQRYRQAPGHVVTPTFMDAFLLAKNHVPPLPLARLQPLELESKTDLVV